MIYVDPEVLKHLPKPTPSRKSARSRSRPRRRSPTPNKDKDKDQTQPHSKTKNSRSGKTSPSNFGNLTDDDSVNTHDTGNSTRTHANVIVHTGKKDFIVFGQDKESTKDCLVEIVVKDPWSNSFEVRVVNDIVGNLATRIITIAEAKKIQSWFEVSTNSGNDIHDLQDVLSNLFMEADKTGVGQLKYDEFIECMETADLGITGAELRMVMAEADDNDDGVIDYEGE